MTGWTRCRDGIPGTMYVVGMDEMPETVMTEWMPEIFVPECVKRRIL